MVTKEMIGAAHDICLKKGDFVLSANLLERIYLAMRDKAEGNDSAGWDAYEDLRKASDEMVLKLRQRVAELEMEAKQLRDLQYQLMRSGALVAIEKCKNATGQRRVIDMYVSANQIAEDLLNAMDSGA